VAIQKFSTTGCIAQTKATEESPWASVRSISQIGRVDRDRLSQTPPWSTGTPVSRNPASRSCSKSTAISARRCWRSRRSVAKSADSARMLS